MGMAGMGCALVWFSIFAGAAVGNPVDDLVQSMHGSEEQERPEQGSKNRTGELPDLNTMRLDLHHDHYGRLSSLSAEELVEVLKVLGYRDTAVRDDGKAALVLLEDPLMSTSLHGHEIDNKCTATVAVKHRHFSVGDCTGADNDNVPEVEKLSFVNSWNGDTLFTVAWWHDGGMCLEISAQLTKYDKANLHLIQRVMRHFHQQKQVFDLKYGLAQGRFTSRRLGSPSLDELVQHLAVQQKEHEEGEGHKQQEPGGPMPDLHAMFAEVQADSDERLTDPSQEDMLSMLRALGYKDCAPGHKGSVILFLEDPLSVSTIHHQRLKDKAAMSVRSNKGNSITILACYATDLPREQKLRLLNHWGSTKSFVSPFTDSGGGVCLEADVMLTKYSMANLQLLQTRMSAVAIMTEAFHLELALKETEAKEAAKEKRPAWQFWR